MTIYPNIYLIDSNGVTWLIGVNANGQLTSTVVGAQPTAVASIALNDVVVAQTWSFGITPAGFLTTTFLGSGNSPSAANGLSVVASTNVVWKIQVSNSQLQTTVGAPAAAAISVYPSIETVMNLVRVYLNDWQKGATGTPGEGQITYDGAPQTLPALNSAIREVYRELRNVGDPELLRDNVQVNLPANGLNGPNVQTCLGFDGYFDGATQQNSPTLPNDIMYPEKLWEQQTGSQLPFVPMHQVQSGLCSVMEQSVCLGQWEWREGKLWFVGAIAPVTIRMRYYCSLRQFLTISAAAFPTTYIPIQDCEEAVAAKTAFKIARALSGITPAVSDLKQDAMDAMFQLRNAIARRAQSVDYHRQPYGSSCEDDADGNFSTSNSNTI